MKFALVTFAWILSFPALAAPTTALPTIDLAYRNAQGATDAERRLVILQGSRSPNAQPLASLCGEAGANCTCLYHLSAQQGQPSESALRAVNLAANSVSCAIPASLAPEQVRYVSLHQSNGRWDSALFAPKASLTLDDVLGDLNADFVRSLYRYQCARTFFEGEGVSATSVNCLPGQHLGVITANYNFYLYQSAVDNNMSERGADTAFSASVCDNNSFLQVQCTGSIPSARFGLYSREAGPFTVGISMSPSPTIRFDPTVYGFAALPDTAGNCPLGLVKASPYTAQPASIMPGDHDVLGQPFPYPSNFQNLNNMLNDVVVETEAPAPLPVLRQANATPCDSTGNCTSATFAAPTTAGLAAYTSTTPVVCVIPVSLLPAR